MFPATLFDYNGVLANDETVHLEAFQEALAPLGVELTEADYMQRYLGFDDAGAFRAVLEDAGRAPTPEQIAELIELKRPLYMKRAAALPTFPGAAELVRRRAAAGPALIVSGALRDEIELGLALLDVRDAIAAIVSAEDTRACKPDPEGYLIAIQLLTRQASASVAERALVIEDSLAGVLAAKAARLPCLAVAHTYSAAELSEAGADGVTQTLAQIDDALLSELYRRLYA